MQTTTRKPSPIIQAGYLPATNWTRETLAERLRYWRTNGFAVSRAGAGRYFIAPYSITTR